MMDSLTQEEVRMAQAEALKSINELKDGAKPHRAAPTSPWPFVLLDVRKANEDMQQMANTVNEIRDDMGKIGDNLDEMMGDVNEIK
jgi:methyl-accepting chemotaxis protein